MKVTLAVFCVLMGASMAFSQAKPPTAFFECGVRQLVYRYHGEAGRMGWYYSPRVPEGTNVYKGTKTHTVLRCSEKGDTLVYRTEFAGTKDSFVVPVDPSRNGAPIFADSANFVKRDTVTMVDTTVCYYPFQMTYEGTVSMHITCNDSLARLHPGTYLSAFKINTLKPARYILAIDTPVMPRTYVRDTFLVDTTMGVLRARAHQARTPGIGTPYSYFHSAYDLLECDGVPVDQETTGHKWQEMLSTKIMVRRRNPEPGIFLEGTWFEITGRRLRDAGGPTPSVLLPKTP